LKEQTRHFLRHKGFDRLTLYFIAGNMTLNCAVIILIASESRFGFRKSFEAALQLNFDSLLSIPLNADFITCLYADFIDNIIILLNLDYVKVTI